MNATSDKQTSWDGPSPTTGLKVPEGEIAMNDLHRQLNCLREEASGLRDKLDAALNLPSPVNSVSETSVPTTSSTLLSNIYDATGKVAAIREIVSDISSRYVF